MLEIYKEERLISKDNKKLIKFINTHFDIAMYELNINKKDEEYMGLIDGAVYLDNNLIETPFGRTDLSSLSTGCKTLILLNHYKTDSNIVVSVLECGENVVNIIYNLDNISIFSPYTNIPLDYNKKVKL